MHPDSIASEVSTAIVPLLVILVAHTLGDYFAVCRDVVAPDPSTFHSNPILQLASPGLEGIANSDVDVLMSMVLIGVAARDDLSTGHTDINDDVVDVALSMMFMRRSGSYRF